MTFGDMMALLLTFFVLLVGVSSPDPGKFDKAIQSIQDALGAAVLTKEKVVERELRVEESFQQITQDVQEVIDKGSMQDVVEVEVTERGIVLNIVGGALFRAGSAKVEKGIGPLLLGVALIVKKLPFKVLVEGTPTIPKRKEKYIHRTGNFLPPGPLLWFISWSIKADWTRRGFLQRVMRNFGRFTLPPPRIGKKIGELKSSYRGKATAVNSAIKILV